MYSYRQGGGAWGPSESAVVPGFGLTETDENEIIRLKVRAIDNAGNSSPIRIATVISTPGTLTPEDVGQEGPGETGNSPMISEPLGEIESGGALRDSDPDEEKLCDIDPSPCGVINRNKIVEHALEWYLPNTTNDEARILHDPHYGYYGGGAGGDCTNFTSQVLHAGGMEFMRADGLNTTDATDPEAAGHYHRGQGSWWSYFQVTPLGGSGYTQRTYEVSESFIRANVLYRHLLEYRLVRVLEPTDKVKRGDLVFYNLHGLSAAGIDHTQVVVGVSHKVARVVQHSPGYLESLKRIENRLNKPGYQRGTDWTRIIVEPIHTAANIEDYVPYEE